MNRPTTPTPPFTDRPIFWAILLLVINVVLKGIYLGHPDIGLDEPFTLFRAQKTYFELIADLADNNHPPLFESLVWLWLRIVGFHKEWLRLLPMLLSTAAALAIFHTGRKHFSLFVGVTAALLFSFSNYHFYLSHELRSYPLFALVTTLSLHFYFRMLASETQNSKAWLLQGFWGAILLYTHYFGAFVILAQVAHALLVARERKLTLTQVKAGIFTTVLYLPQIAMVLDRWVDKVEGGHWLQSPSMAELFNVLSKFMNAPVLTLLALILTVVGVFLASKRHGQNKVYALLLLFPGMFVLMWVVAQFLPIFQDRYISFTLIGWFLLIAIALDQLPKIGKLVLTLALVGTMATTVSYRPDNGQWTKEMVALIHAHKSSETDVYIYPHWSVACFSFHYNQDYFNDYRNTEDLMAEEAIFFLRSGNDPKIQESLLQGRKVILINFEGPISESLKDFEGFKTSIIEKDRQGMAIIDAQLKD